MGIITKTMLNLMLTAFGQIIKYFENNPEVIKRGLDKMLDEIENYVEKTENKIDDVLVLNSIKMLRSVFDIPDNDEDKGEN
ncbi:MAG: hypothetical protein DRN81_05075 [Thermoproteota archaeon]|nr:MAG: hypothetical protein DRN81_05075 [Candidatus Korarchaeota archaeon]